MEKLCIIGMIKGGLFMKRKRNLYSEIKSENKPLDDFGYEEYCDLAERGLKDDYIAKELNVTESFLRELKRDGKENF